MSNYKVFPPSTFTIMFFVASWFLISASPHDFRIQQTLLEPILKIIEAISKIEKWFEVKDGDRI